MQENWIGKSGDAIRFRLDGQDKLLEIFTTRHDTIFGAVFGPVARPSVDGEFGKKFRPGGVCCRVPSSGYRRSRTLETAEKKVLLPDLRPSIRSSRPYPPGLCRQLRADGLRRRRHIRLPPAHDQRGLDFARKYKLPVVPVVVPDDKDPKNFDVGTEAYTGPGHLANSDFFKRTFS